MWLLRMAKQAADWETFGYSWNRHAAAHAAGRKGHNPLVGREVQDRRKGTNNRSVRVRGSLTAESGFNPIWVQVS